MKNIFFIAALLAGHSIVAQNVGIGTNYPQQKLHVAGGLRLDTLTAGNNYFRGVLQSNENGDVSKLPFSYNSNDVLKGDGSWGQANGAVSSFGIIASKIYNNTDLLNAGYSLYGELPAALKYSTYNGTLYSGTWQPTYNRGIISNVSAPVFNNSMFSDAIPVSNGIKLYVPTTSNMYAYDPITDLWSIVSNQGLAISYAWKAIWIGNEFIFIDGLSPLNSRRYNISTNTWSSISTVNALDYRNRFSLVWDGTRVIAWGGTNGTGPLNTGAMYNPATDTWTVMSTAGAPAARLNHTAIWSPATNSMIIWGGRVTLTSVLNTGGIFNPVTNTWTGATNTTGPPAARNSHTAIWSGTEMIIFGGGTAGISINTGGKYNPVTNSWTSTSTSGAPAVYDHAVTWTGAEMFLSGGINGGTTQTGSASYNPVTNTWITKIGFDGKDSHSSFLIGNIITIFGGGTTSADFKTRDNNGFRYFLANTVSSVTTTTEETLYLYIKN